MPRFACPGMISEEMSIEKERKKEGRK